MMNSYDKCSSSQNASEKVSLPLLLMIIKSGVALMKFVHMLRIVVPSNVVLHGRQRSTDFEISSKCTLILAIHFPNAVAMLQSCSHRENKTSLEQPPSTRSAHSPLHTLQTHARESSAPTIPISLIPPQRLSQVCWCKRPLITRLQPILQTSIFLHLLPQTLRAINLRRIPARTRNIGISRPIPIILDMSTRSDQTLTEYGAW